MKEFDSFTRKVLAVFAAITAWFIMGVIVLWLLQTFGITRIGIKFVMLDIAALAIAVWAAVSFVKGKDKPEK